MRRLLLIAVLAEVAFSLGAGIHALAIRNWVALPGAFLRAVIMGTLGYCALRGQPRWCLWTFVTFEYMTGLGALALGFVWARKHDVHLRARFPHHIRGVLGAGIGGHFRRSRTDNSSVDNGALEQQVAAAEAGARDGASQLNLLLSRPFTG